MTYSWQPSHCTLSYMVATSTKLGVPPIQSCLDDMQYGECNTGKHCTSCQLIREYYWPKTKYVTVSAVWLIQYWTRGEQPRGWGLYKSYSTCQVATDDVSFNVCPSTSRRQTLLVRLMSPRQCYSKMYEICNLYKLWNSLTVGYNMSSCSHGWGTTHSLPEVGMAKFLGVLRAPVAERIPLSKFLNPLLDISIPPSQ